MNPTVWLENETGETWDLHPKKIRTAGSAAFLRDLTGTGFKRKLTYAQIGDDFAETDDKAEQVLLSGTIIFDTPAKLQEFGVFTGGFDKYVKLCYDPAGLLGPGALGKPWFKQVKINELKGGTVNQYGFLEYPISFTPKSALWRKETTVASSTTVVDAKAHVYNYTYPYFYQTDRKLYLVINNGGSKIGCMIKITNNSSVPLTKTTWTATSENGAQQYASWLNGTTLEAGRTLIVDSDTASQRAVVEYQGSSTDVSQTQEPNPQYINFIELESGDNTIIFDLGEIDNIDIEVSYTERVRAL